MSCNQLRLKRGAPTPYYYTVLDEEGVERPFAAGEYAVLSIGRVTATGAALLQKSTDNPSEGSTTVGSAVATFYILGMDTDDTLKGASYQADIFIGGAASSPIPIDDIIQVTVEGRVNPSPPGP